MKKKNYDIQVLDNTNIDQYKGKTFSARIVKIRGLKFEKLPFNVTECELFWAINCGLKTLEGAPKKVNYSFYCSENPLKNLVGGPSYVGGHYYCDNCELESLEGAPEEVGFNGDGLVENKCGFYCYDNLLENLEYAPKKVSGDFDISNNKIISLDNAPMYVGGNFVCDESIISNENIAIQNERYRKIRLLETNFNKNC